MIPGLERLGPSLRKTISAPSRWGGAEQVPRDHTAQNSKRQCSASAGMRILRFGRYAGGIVARHATPPQAPLMRNQRAQNAERASRLNLKGSAG